MHDSSTDRREVGTEAVRRCENKGDPSERSIGGRHRGQGGGGARTRPDRHAITPGLPGVDKQPWGCQALLPSGVFRVLLRSALRQSSECDESGDLLSVSGNLHAILAFHLTRCQGPPTAIPRRKLDSVTLFELGFDGRRGAPDGPRRETWFVRERTPYVGTGLTDACQHDASG
jgi:hypothetical protein